MECGERMDYRPGQAKLFFFPRHPHHEHITRSKGQRVNEGLGCGEEKSRICRVEEFDWLLVSSDPLGWDHRLQTCPS